MDRREFFKKAAIGGVAAAAVLSSKQSQASGTGTMTGFIDVTAAGYGAIGDGTTDDSTAFEDAASDAAADGCVLWIPPGVYNLSSNWNSIDEENITILGAGRELVTIKGSSSDSFIKLATTADRVDSVKLTGVTVTDFKYVVHAITNGEDLGAVEIKECAFDNIVAQVYGSGGGVDMATIDRFEFSDNIVTNVGASVTSGFAAALKLSATDCLNTVCDRNLIDGVGNGSKTSGDTFGLLLIPAGADETNLQLDAKSHVRGNTIRNIESSNTSECWGIMVLGGQSIITDNHIESVSASSGSTDVGAIYTKCRNSVISDNSMTNCEGNVGVIACKGDDRAHTSGNASPGYDNVISNNNIRIDKSLATQRSIGIFVSTVGVIISSNRITGTWRGISVDKNEANITIQSNIMYDLGSSTDADWTTGVYVSQANDCLILDNQIVKLNGKNSSLVAGIYLSQPSSSSVSSRGSLIRGNWIADVGGISPTTAAGIQINFGPAAATATYEKLIVESNHIDNVDKGINVSELSAATHSSAIRNTVSNAATSDITPSTGWDVYDQ